MNRRAVSLRTRVAGAAALGALIVVSGVAAGISVAIARNNLDHLDRRLDTAAQLLELNADAAEMFVGRVGDVGSFAVTLRDGDDVRSTPTWMPPLGHGHHSVPIDNVTYRVTTVTMNRAGGKLFISVATPIQQAQTITRIQQRRTASTPAPRCRKGIPTFATTTSRPPRSRPCWGTSRRRAPAPSPPPRRTPLTAMRTDLEVILDRDLPTHQRTEIPRDVPRKQSGVESTLTALESLASGELVRTDRRVPADVIELADKAVRDAGRRHPGVDIQVRSEPPLVADVRPTGLRLALDKRHRQSRQTRAGRPRRHHRRA